MEIAYHRGCRWSTAFWINEFVRNLSPGVNFFGHEKNHCYRRCPAVQPATRLGPGLGQVDAGKVPTPPGMGRHKTRQSRGTHVCDLSRIETEAPRIYCDPS